MTTSHDSREISGRIAYDTTPMFVSRAGVARYTRALRDGLGSTLGRRLVEISCMQEHPTSLLERVRAGLYREGLYYPLDLSRRARAARADVIHTPGPFPARGHGIPTVITMHDALPWRYPELFTRVNAVHQRALVGLAARQATAVITMSEHSRRELVEFLDLDADSIVITPLGVAEPFAAMPADPERLADRFGLAGPYVLSVGTLEPRKNLERVLKAFTRARAQLPEHQLVLAGGTGWGTAELEQRLDMTVGVSRTGHVTDAELAWLYQGCDVFVYPSLYEGFGLPPLEAMSCGAPVISSDSTSLPEVLGDAAILIDPTKTDELADALVRVVTSPDLADELSRKGLARSAAFTWDRCAAQTMRVYEFAAGRAGGG